MAPTLVSTSVVQDATATPSPMPVNLEGLEISSQGNVIMVSLAGLPEAVVDQVQSLPKVTNVERYLRVATSDYPDPFVGVEPGSALRVGDTIVSLAVGESFQSRDEQVAIPGFSLNSNPYIYASGMAHNMMAHRFSTGQSFLIHGVRLRVVGVFWAPDKSLENAILVPLGTAQRLFNMEGQLTSTFVTVKSEKNIDEVAAEIRNILGGG